MRMTPNLNGTSLERLLDERREIAEACTELLRRLDLHFPHPRDYQLASQPSQAYCMDSSDWAAFTRSVVEFRARMKDEHAELEAIQERKGVKP